MHTIVLVIHTESPHGNPWTIAAVRVDGGGDNLFWIVGRMVERPEHSYTSKVDTLERALEIVEED